MVTLSSPLWWFEEIVEPNYQEFLQNRLSRRHAINAASTTYHFFERLYHYYSQEGRTSDLLGSTRLSDFRDALISKCPDLGLLREVANATKHHLIERKSSSKVMTATGMTHVTETDLVVGDTGRQFSDVIGNVMRFWREWLDQHP